MRLYQITVVLLLVNICCYENHTNEIVDKQVITLIFCEGDFLQRTSPGSLYHDSWPSLFIAPSGCRSELHVDAFGSNFWMALFEGRKRFSHQSSYFTVFILVILVLIVLFTTCSRVLGFSLVIDL